MLNLIILPGVDTIAKSTYQHFMSQTVFRTGLALNLYADAHGGLPETLDALVPDYLSHIPEDIFAAGNAHLRYVREDSECFRLYSLGKNYEDDGGTYNFINYFEGDIVYRGRRAMWEEVE